jgi:phage shock protein PspC (stress-responsive transcriptional regulator)
VLVPQDAPAPQDAAAPQDAPTPDNQTVRHDASTPAEEALPQDEAPPQDTQAAQDEAAPEDVPAKRDEPANSVHDESAPPGPQPGPTAGFPSPDAAGFPPPGGYVPPPPGTAGYATRFGLVRPTRGRYIAGVCGALGRATNTDPVLWRVGLPALLLLGGLGGLIYIIAWLVIPSEGDSASPIEALAGRGWSSTSRVVTIVLAVITVIAVFNGPAHFGGGLLVAAVVIGGIVLLATSRNNMPASWPKVSRSPSGFSVHWPPAATQATTGTTAAGQAAGAGSTPSTVTTPAEAPEPPPASETAAYSAVPAWTPLPATQPLAPSGSGYQPPFAPYGPYAPATPYPSEFPGLGTTAPLPPPAKVKRPRSPMRRITISIAVLVTGLLAVLDLSNVLSVPTSVYFAAPLATIGAGLVIGSFFGRMRGPITLGVLLTFCLLISTAVEGHRNDLVSRDNTFRPTTITELRDSYSQQFGEITLDLSKIDFTNSARSVDINIKAGHISVILPPTVDTSVTARVGIGDSSVFDHGRDGINTGTMRVTDNGVDGPGGGSLHLNVHVAVGELEVLR